MKKSEKTARCKEILHGYKIGTKVTKSEDIDFLLKIFEGHTEWEMKVGVGVESISIVETIYRNRCFQLNRVDGSKTDISYTHSISNRSKLSDVKAACRSAIRNEIASFRSNNVVFGVDACPFTGETLMEYNTHIDHYDLTFNEMFKIWVSGKEIELLHAKVCETTDDSEITKFTDSGIVTEFIQFHNANCKLRAVSKIANLSILR